MWDPIQGNGPVNPFGKLPTLTYTGDGYNIGNLYVVGDKGGYSTHPVGGGGGTDYHIHGSKSWSINEGPRADWIALGAKKEKVDLNDDSVSGIS